MRLSDHIQAARGSDSDVANIISNVADAILDAERFELSDDVAVAAYQLTTNKPTSLLNALPLCRAPYRKMWIEWRGGATTRTDMIKPVNRRDPAFAPDPLRQGCLVETDETGQRGTMTFAWVHKDRPESEYSPVNIAPLGAIFDWSEGAKIKEISRQELIRRHGLSDSAKKANANAVLDTIIFTRHNKTLSDEEAKQWMKRSAFHDWARFANVTSERQALKELGEHSMPWVVDHALGFFSWCAERAMSSEQLLRTFLNTIVAESWEMDIEGEPPFIDTVIAMMNSRNAIENRPVDLSGLNKSRAKRGRPVFLDYQTTHLRLSQAQSRAMRAGWMSRSDAGLHNVRGHFKIRKSGVYWWSPFYRGDPTKPIERAHYKVM
jgi:hypothetical protein